MSLRRVDYSSNPPCRRINNIFYCRVSAPHAYALLLPGFAPCSRSPGAVLSPVAVPPSDTFVMSTEAHDSVSISRVLDVTF